MNTRGLGYLTIILIIHEYLFINPKEDYDVPALLVIKVWFLYLSLMAYQPSWFI